MNIGLFGGTFDPIHHGHMALARGAKERFNLGCIHFVPANIPPHKQRHPVTSYFHRYTMVALATANHKAFRPSLLEAPPEPAVTEIKDKKVKSNPEASVNYSIDTVRRLKQTLKKSDRLFFLIGIDAFKEIAGWREAEALFRECEFIVASRPGYSLADVANALPEKLRPKSEITTRWRAGVGPADVHVKAMLLRIIWLLAQVPFADAGRCISKRLERLRDRDFFQG